METGADVRTLNIAAGENFCMKAIEAGLSQHRPVLFFITQGESSTGVHQPIEQLGTLCHKYYFLQYLSVHTILINMLYVILYICKTPVLLLVLVLVLCMYSFGQF